MKKRFGEKEVKKLRAWETEYTNGWRADHIWKQKYDPQSAANFSGSQALYL